MTPRKRFCLAGPSSSSDPISSASLVAAHFLDGIRNLELEMEHLETGIHQALLKKLNERDMKYLYDTKKLQAGIEWTRDDIDDEFATDDSSLRKELEGREHELLESLLNECDERKKQIEKDSNCDSFMLNGSAVQYPISKKFLRNRRGHDLTPDKRKLPKTPGTVVCLLSEAEIAQDVRDINKVLPRDEIPRTHTQTEFLDTKRIKKVNVDSQRVSVDGKLFYRGQNLVVETANYGRFPALLQSIVEKVAHFKSTLPGDTRMVMATQDDLECGRVVIKKRS
ncbi:hypothetical protein L596_016932 [Steinernema carpocapsae]|uniref:Uncharacterized protein n=1 Tax=Steinernema carpocapsae TaxID=34508 RepID=A0A4U5MZP6_STECR|nr:hypothetical protein L596_016932 [Steinernema carpocapsae]